MLEDPLLLRSTSRGATSRDAPIARLVAALAEHQPHWSVGSLALRVMIETATPAALVEADRAAEEIAGWRAHLTRGLHTLGIPTAGGDAPFVLARVGTGVREALRERAITLRGQEARDAGAVWLARGGVTWQLATPDRDRREARARASGPTGPQVRSAMPGTVVSVAVRTGDVVEAGQPLLAIEAMKMEHTLLSSVAGTVTVSVAEGDQVRLDQVVATIHPHEGEPG